MSEKVAILCSISFNKAMVKRQLINYHLSHGNMGYHFLHVANDGDINNSDFADKEFDYVNVDSSKFSTSRKCNFGGQMANTERLLTTLDKNKFSHVYIHTDADLIVQGDVADFVKKKSCGFRKNKPNKKWVHFERMVSDPYFKKMRNDLEIGEAEILIGRQEGAFFPIDLWKDIYNLFSKYYPIDFFSNKNLIWPIEEGVLPTIANYLIKKRYNNLKVTERNIVITKALKPTGDKRNPREIPENCVQIDDINKEISKLERADCIAMKWFSKVKDDGASLYANEALLKSLKNKRKSHFL